jgi:hypothetical protein
MGKTNVQFVSKFTYLTKQNLCASVLSTLYIMRKTNKVLSFVKNNHKNEHLNSIAYSLSLSFSE